MTMSVHFVHSTCKWAIDGIMRPGANGREHELPRRQELGLRGRRVQGHHCQWKGDLRRRRRRPQSKDFMFG